MLCLQYTLEIESWCLLLSTQYWHFIAKCQLQEEDVFCGCMKDSALCPRNQVHEHFSKLGMAGKQRWGMEIQFAPRFFPKVSGMKSWMTASANIIFWQTLDLELSHRNVQPVFSLCISSGHTETLLVTKFQLQLYVNSMCLSSLGTIPELWGWFADQLTYFWKVWGFWNKESVLTKLCNFDFISLIFYIQGQRFEKIPGLIPMLVIYWIFLNYMWIDPSCLSSVEVSATERPFDNEQVTIKHCQRSIKLVVWYESSRYNPRRHDLTDKLLTV